MTPMPHRQDGLGRAYSVPISELERVEHLIRDIPDYPQEGVLFKDLTPVMADPLAFAWVVESLSAIAEAEMIDVVVGVEARGFVFGAAVAHRLCSPFVPVRKPGKLPGSTCSVAYELEYGTDGLEIHVDAIAIGARVAIVDDVLATGGTARAAVRLVESLGATVVGLEFLVELTALDGRRGLDDYRIESVIEY